MNARYVTKVWDLAKVYKVREETMIIAKGISGYLEFDEVIGERYHYILIEDEEKPIGTLRINIENADFAKLERVAVIPAYQKRGVGRQLVIAAEEWLREQGYQKIVITSQLHAVAFYEKLGYQADFERKVDAGLPCVYMEKNLENGVVVK